MKIIESPLKGCYILEPITYEDERGLFYESYHKDRFDKSIGENVDFVQDNVSISKKGVLRGLHYQKGDSAQAKLVHVLKGEVLDVIVDLRKGSSSYGKHFKMKLSDKNKTSIFIPKGMAHGFLALTNDVIFSYKCDALYNPKSEAGILYNDPVLDIKWEMAENELILSDKDLKLPMFKELEL